MFPTKFIFALQHYFLNMLQWKGGKPVPRVKSKYIRSMVNIRQTKSKSLQVKVLGLIFTAGGLEMPKDKHA